MYISPVDKLGVSLDELIALDSKGLIRIEKRLKLQRLQRKEEVYNPQQFDELLSQLADPEKKKAILFVEKHTNLKEFITTGTDNGVKTFVLDAVDLKQTPFLKDFLAPYFDAYFMKMVKRDYRLNIYDTILKAMQYKSLFTDTLLTQYYEYITAQVSILVEKINIAKKGELTNKCPQIAYKTFVQLMNTVPLGFIKKTKVAYANAMVDYYNKTLNKHSEFPIIKRAFQNFKEIETGDQELQLFLNKLSSQITNTASYSQSTSQSRSQSTSSGSSSWKTVAMVIGILVFIVRVARIFTRNSSNYTPSTNTTFKAPTITTSYDDDKTAFYSDLIHKSSDDSITNYSETLLRSNKNLYPLQFFSISESNSSNAKTITIKNNRKHQLVVFVESNNAIYKYRSTSFLARDAIDLPIYRNTKLVFYAGTDFITAKSSQRIIATNNGFTFKPSKRYFRNVSDVELAWLKNKYVIDAIGENPSIELVDDQLVFEDIEYHIVQNKILPPEKEEIVEEVVFESTDSYQTREVRNAWKSPKNLFFEKLENESIQKGEAKVLQNGENPYPNVFKSIKSNSITGYDVVFKNESNQDLIVFSRNLSLERDQATFIAKKDSVTLLMHDTNDTLFFYKGNKFQTLPISEKDTDLEKKNVPSGYFKDITKTGKTILKKPFAIKSLGADPVIKITNTEVLFEDIEYTN